MRRLLADSWCRKYTIPTLLLMVALLVLPLACDFNAKVRHGEVGDDGTFVETPPPPKFWVTHSLDFGGGPYFYSTREIISLPDGTGVVCVATIKDLWCKEVTDERLH